jgi:hypothetical protein
LRAAHPEFAYDVVCGASGAVWLADGGPVWLADGGPVWVGDNVSGDDWYRAALQVGGLYVSPAYLSPIDQSLVIAITSVAYAPTPSGAAPVPRGVVMFALDLRHVQGYAADLAQAQQLS